MTRIVVTVPIASMLSANGRGATWHAKAAKTSDLRNLGFLAARLVVPPVGHLMQRAHLTVYIAAPTARRRDAANLHPTVKALLDGMVAYGVLPDDSDAYLVGPDLRPDTERSDAGTYRFTFDFEDLAEEHPRPLPSGMAQPEPGCTCDPYGAAQFHFDGERHLQLDRDP